jgi:hypothetical protein
MNLENKLILFLINKELYYFQKKYFKIEKSDLDYIIDNNIKIKENKIFSENDLWYIMLNTNQNFDINFNINKLNNFKNTYTLFSPNPHINFCVSLSKICWDTSYDIIIGISLLDNIENILGFIPDNNIININQIIHYDIFSPHKKIFKMNFIDISKYKLHNINCNIDDVYILVGNFRNELREKYYNKLEYINI